MTKLSKKEREALKEIENDLSVIGKQIGGYSGEYVGLIEAEGMEDDILTHSWTIGQILKGELRGDRKPRRRKNAHQKWNRKDKKFLRDHAGRWAKTLIAAKLCRTMSSVQMQAQKMNLSLRKTKKHLRLAA